MNFEAIIAAQKRLDGHARVTPLLSDPALDDIAGKRVLIKAECLQHTGSFKFRGGWSAISALSPEERMQGVLAYSSGNHAQGVAFAAKHHTTNAVIVMPSDAPAAKINNTRDLGAEVILYDRATDDRDAIGQEIATTRGLTLIKPFDNPQVIAGQGTVGLEIAKQARALGVTSADVLVSCGGGGLTAGIALALEQKAPNFRVRPVEPVGFDDVARSLSSGKAERNPTTTGSVCDAILTPSPGALTFPIMHRLCGAGLTATDEACLRTMALAFSRLKIVLEPGGAIALAAALFGGDALTSETVIAVATGGNVDADLFANTLERYT